MAVITDFSQVDLTEVVAAAEADENMGFCLSCGHEQGAVEPDARGYICEACEAAQVYGAEEIVIMAAVA